MCPSNKRKSSLNKWEQNNNHETPSKKQCLEGNASKIAESSTRNMKGWTKWKKHGVEFDPKKRNSALPRQIAEDRKKARAYIPPLHLFEDKSREYSFYSDEDDLDGLDYDETHLAFDREKSPKLDF
uniref:Uncharacterized protein n=1 Tax=Tanacetum cinerariifolium TaxID=118510 RepID=A0A6L2M6W5_TANCI|nr:hypothetical protein [Tanacetum cinerariifolium]